MKCANHPDRIALGYCANCGKPLCSSCLVRLPSGNYCQTCANPPDRPAARRRIPWWGIALAVLFILILLRALVH